MPCGNAHLFENPFDILTLPVGDMMCPCGNPNHYIIRFSDMREENDNNSGTGQLDSDIGGDNTSQPQFKSKPKTKKKARKRVS
jgi:hypothetical protein